MSTAYDIAKGLNDYIQNDLDIECTLEKVDNGANLVFDFDFNGKGMLMLVSIFDYGIAVFGACSVGTIDINEDVLNIINDINNETTFHKVYVDHDGVLSMDYFTSVDYSLDSAIDFVIDVFDSFKDDLFDENTEDLFAELCEYIVEDDE